MLKVSILKTLFWMVGIVAILVMVVLPLASGVMIRAGFFPDWLADAMRTTEDLQRFGMQAFVVCWVVFLGACFASFLNVVAWRVPRGRGINGSSHCPNCDVRLSFRDNLPIVGWIRNGGRCRSCRQSISARYLIVEIILGIVTLLIVALEIFWGGFNLPGYAGKPFAMLDNLVVNPKYELIQTASLHLVLVYTLFTIAIIRSERLAVPQVVWMTAAVIAIGLMAVFPHAVVSPIYLWGTSFDRFSMNWVATLAGGGLVGLGVGLFFDQARLFSAVVDDAWERDQKLLAGKSCSVELAAGADRIIEDEENVVTDFELNSAAIDDATESRLAVMDIGQEEVAGENPARYPAVVAIGEGAAVFSLVGLCLGWLAALMVGAMLLLVCLPIRLAWRCDSCAPLGIQALAATIVFVCGWRFLTVWTALL